MVAQKMAQATRSSARKTVSGQNITRCDRENQGRLSFFTFLNREFYASLCLPLWAGQS